MDKSAKVATPLAAGTVVRPDSRPLPGLVPGARLTSAVESVTLSNRSRMTTFTAGVMAARATWVVGWMGKAILEALAGFISNAALVSPVRPGELAFSV